MEKIRVFHCADLHLGQRFKSYPEGLAEARFRTLERMVALANSENCDLFVVAGDLFDHLKVAARDVLRAAKILSTFEKICLVLPGNHDFHSGTSQDDFWRHFELPEHGRMLLLQDGRRYDLKELGLDATVYAAPCTSKLSKSHSLGWIQEPGVKTASQFHIGVAHGSFEGLSPDMQGEYFPMKKADLERCGLDLWLLGHIHLQYPPRAVGIGDRIFYSGTHEPDGFDCRHEGKAWIIDLAADKTVSARSVPTGEYRFRREELELRSLDTLEKLSREHTDSEAKKILLRLKLNGALPRADFESLPEILARLHRRFFHVETDVSKLGVRLAPADIDKAYAQGSYPHRLLSALAGSPADAEALQAAFELLQETAGREGAR